jgi:hypothetical protein
LTFPAEQVAAWVKLAQLVQDPAFRARVREMAVAGASASSVPDDGDGAALAAAVSEHAGAAHSAGVDPTSAEAAAVVERVAPQGDRAALADQLERFTDARVDRYWALFAVINGWPAWPSQIPAFEWFVAGLRA